MLETLKEAGGRKSSSEGSTVHADRSSVFFASLLRLCVNKKHHLLVSLFLLLLLLYPRHARPS